MDPKFHEYPSQENSSRAELLPPSEPFSSGNVPGSLADINDDYQDYCDFSNEMLKYIDQMLMEEDTEDKTDMLQESLDLQAKEKSFYEQLGKKYPSSVQSVWNLNKGVLPSGDNFSVNVDINGLPAQGQSLGDTFELEKKDEEDGKRKVSSVGKGHDKFPNKKKEVIDLQTLLITCAEAVAADNCQNASEHLKQIRQHSSPFGDGNQRLAHYFANGLEARLAGNCSKLHKAMVSKSTTAADYLKAYYTYLATSPFYKISGLASNKTIVDRSRKATRVHVIDFGIHYGFQWPGLIRRISFREGGPPRLRITGIDFPQPGLEPAKKIEDTGRRLARYAKTFNVPFEYNAIAQNWETIKVEDLKIEEDELVVVTCLYRTKNLPDQTVGAESSRTQVLNLIRRINPTIFIHGVVNGAYSAPYFHRRFKEVLFHFSALFDMLENNIPREKPERLLIERDIFGREALNVIACEGRERVERPETYTQWQTWNLRAGFSQVSFGKEVMSMSTNKVRSFYHKDFLIEEHGPWMFLGWKGRIIYAISCWEPA